MSALRRTPDAAPVIASALLATTFFLLSADLLYLPVESQKIKYGYFLVLLMWLPSPRAMLDAVRTGLRRIPAYAWLPLAPLAVSVATSVSPRDSLLWTLWLGFDIFTVATVYAFLTTRDLAQATVARAFGASLAAMALFGIVQFIMIYGFGRLVFSPQSHFDVFRINGLSGWPHFLNIYAFILLPIVITQARLRWAALAMLALLMFVLVQSTAKTGWVLFVVLGCLMLLLDRPLFMRRWLFFLLPVTVIALSIPTPSFRHADAPISGGEKVRKFSKDLDLANATTSGTDRVLISVMGLNVWLKHPWFGVGPRAYRTYVLTRFDEELPGVNKYDANRQVNIKNENIWIELLAENGALFTLSFAFVLMRALLVPGWRFANRLHMGSWMALVLYFTVSGQFSQTALLTIAYAMLGIYFYAAQVRPMSLEPEAMPTRSASASII